MIGALALLAILVNLSFRNEHAGVNRDHMQCLCLQAKWSGLILMDHMTPYATVTIIGLSFVIIMVCSC